MYGNRVIAICENIKLQIETEVNIAPRKINVIPNGINFTPIEQRQVPSPKILTIAGRTTGPKGEILGRLLIDVFPEVLAQNQDLCIQLVGGELTNLSESAQQQMKTLQAHYPQRLRHIGYVENLSPYLTVSSCVIAAGRIAIEALAQGLPVIALGEALLVGLVDEVNLKVAMASNFGDIGMQYHHDKIDLDTLQATIIKGLNNFQLADEVVEEVRKSYSITYIYHEVMQVYHRSIIEKQHPQHIPILMYHKVLPQAEESQHKTFVTCTQFTQHIRFLAKHGFTTITFKDYFAFRDGERPMHEFPNKPIIMTFDDGYVNNLQYALPIMQQYGFVGVLFALGDGDINYNQWDAGEPQHALMDTKQLQTLVVAGFEIGAHSLTHPDLTKLSSLEATVEIEQSKKNLENILQQPVISFAYPYGYYNDAVKYLVQQAGFHCAVATDTGGLQLEDDRFSIFRVNMMPRDHIIQFFKKTSSWYRKRYWRKRGK